MASRKDYNDDDGYGGGDDDGCGGEVLQEYRGWLHPHLHLFLYRYHYYHHLVVRHPRRLEGM